MSNGLNLLRRSLAASTALVMPLMAGPALAQTAPPAAQTAQTAPDPNKRQIQEIVVTAQHKAEDISKVPMAISALSGDQMEQQGIKSISDIAREVPGLNFQSAGDSFGSTEISIRGVLATAGAATTGVYVDDTPIQVRLSGFTGTSNPYPQVFDLDRVEVLKGPQGTLFGSGSEGGTVRFITPEPSLDKWSGFAREDTSFTEGGDPSGEIGGAIGGPIIDGILGFRASAWIQHEGGWVDRVDYKTGATVDPNSNWEQTKVARVAFKFAPDDRLTITPSVFYQDKYSHDTSLWWLDNGAYQPANGSAPPANDTGRYKNLDQLQQPDDDHFWLTGLNVEYKFDPFTVKSISSWFEREDNRYSDESTYDLSTFVPSNFDGNGFQPYGGVYLPGGAPFASHGFFQNTQQNFDEEIRISSNDQPGDWFSWNVGFYWQHNRQGLGNTIAEPLINVANDATVFGSYGYANLPINPVTGQPICHPTQGNVKGNCTVAELMGTGMLGPYSYVDNEVFHDSEQAIYANLTFHPIEDLTLQAGVRGSRSTFDFVDVQNGPWNSHQLANGNWVGLGIDEASKKEYPITPRFSASYQLSDDQMVFATAAEGYRVGGGNDNLGTLVSCKTDFQNLGISGNPLTYDSDTVWSYELGTKSKFFDKSLQVDASLFWLNWNNIQSQVYLPICGYTYTANLGTATSKGFEATVRWIAADWITLSGNFAYTDARYTSTTSISGNILALKGDSLLTPPLTFAFTAEHDEDIDEDVSLYARTDVTWASHYNRTGSYIVYTSDPITRPGLATTTLGARVGIVTGPWDLSIYGQNLLNAGTPTYVFHDTYYSPAVREESLTPLTVGLTAEYHF